MIYENGFGRFHSRTEMEEAELDAREDEETQKPLYTMMYTLQYRGGN